MDSDLASVAGKQEQMGKQTADAGGAFDVAKHQKLSKTSDKDRTKLTTDSQSEVKAREMPKMFSWCQENEISRETARNRHVQI